MGAGDASISSYLSECGVLDVVYFLQGSTTTSSEINEIGSTLSLYITNRRIRSPRCGTNIIAMTDNLHISSVGAPYQTPALEIIDIQTENSFASNGTESFTEGEEVGW